LQNETNTFASTLASFADFEEADSWPGLLRGDEVIHGLSGINISITGCGKGGGRLRNHSGALVFS
jgi:microcystin degradation protein MlrC